MLCDKSLNLISNIPKAGSLVSKPITIAGACQFNEGLLTVLLPM